MLRSLIVFALISTGVASAEEQSCAGQVRGMSLEQAAGRVPTYFSHGHRQRALEIQDLLDRATRYYEHALGVRPLVTVAALDPHDWRSVLDKPYGLPTLRIGPCRGRKPETMQPEYVAILPVTAEGPLTRDWLAMRGTMSRASMRGLRRAGLTFDAGAAEMLEFVALHELGHAYAHAIGIESISSFYAEFTGNYLAYAYLRSTPERRDRKTLAVLRANVDTIRPIHASLERFEQFRSSEDPPTEAWYNSAFTLKAAEVFDRRGVAFLRSVEDSFAGEQYGKITVNEIIARLDRLDPGFIAWRAKLERSPTRRPH